MTDRPRLTTYRNPDLHWVGDGFLTQTMLSARDHVGMSSPFILAGYNPPMWFDATDRPKGVGMHPHRGFETVTIVFQGGVTHGDTLGHRGSIGAGDVQWMTAARGVQHEEFHAEEITAQGGMLEMVQLWVNLPAAHKMDAPRYQAITAADIPQVALPDGGHVRVIAGDYADVRGPVDTVTPLSVWDAYLPAAAEHVIDLPAGKTVSLLVLQGQLALATGEVLTGPETAIFGTDAGLIRLVAQEDAHYLVLSGNPILEPIAMGGPFVMNTEEELHAAFTDFRRGVF